MILQKLLTYKSLLHKNCNKNQIKIKWIKNIYKLMSNQQFKTNLKYKSLKKSNKKIILKRINLKNLFNKHLVVNSKMLSNKRRSLIPLHKLHKKSLKIKSKL